MDTIREQEMTRDKLRFFKDQKIAVHLKLYSGKFYNGQTKSFNDESIVFIDEKLGVILVFLAEIRDVEPREVKE